MKIAIIGGGAAGMACAHYLGHDHQVTIFEKSPILGGNIRTLGKNVKLKAHTLPSNLYIDNGVIEFDEKNFYAFHSLMRELSVKMECIPLNTAFFFRSGKYLLSPSRIFASVPSFWGKLVEFSKLFFTMLDLQWFMLRTLFKRKKDYENIPIGVFFKEHIFHWWLKMLLMYSYSISYNKIDQVPAALGVPMLRSCMAFTKWNRIVGGVYTYIEKILEGFPGEILTSVQITSVTRNAAGVTITIQDREEESFDAVVFATPPHVVLELLKDPNQEEKKRFEGWKENIAHTVIHTDTSIYGPYGIKYLSAFDLFQKEKGDAGYNAFLNGLLGLDPDAIVKYNLSFNMEDRIDSKKIIHTQEHHTPLYTVEGLKHRDQIIASNGENHTFHAGAYLYDGLHEGAIRSALAVKEKIAQLSSSYGNLKS
ncbi:MAG: NAD(P)-binding protein [Bacteriovoracaceae bacterium]|jgi:uncharacterized protein|nr:NAD(P)-binding protein [Bacteriovoracaceae bacterium]